MALSFPIVDGGVQVVQVLGGTSRIVGVGFGEVSTKTDRWFIHKQTAPTMRATSTTDTAIAPLATQSLANRWTLDDWKFASNPAAGHTQADDAQTAHDTRTRLRHGSSAFNYIKTRSVTLAGIPTDQVVIARIPEPFDSEGAIPSGSGSQCDPQFYELLPLDAAGAVVQGASPVGHIFVPRNTPAGAPPGICDAPHSLEIWFIKDRSSFPAPPDDYGFMIRVFNDPNDPNAPNDDSDLADALGYVRVTLGYAQHSDAVTVIMSTTTYDSVRPRFP